MKGIFNKRRGVLFYKNISIFVKNFQKNTAMRTLLPAIITLIFLSGCAKKYTLIKPLTVAYSKNFEDENVKFEYEFGRLGMVGNKKYAKRERENNLQIVCVRITNNSPQIIDIGKQVRWYSAGRQVVPEEMSTVYSTIKQKSWHYLGYLLLTPLNGKVTTQVNNGDKKDVYIPFGYITGPTLGLGNYLYSLSSNNKLKKELTREDIRTKVLQPGEFATGLICFREIGVEPMKIKVKFN